MVRQYGTLLAGLAAVGRHEKARDALPTTPADEWRQCAAAVRLELFAPMSAAGRERAERELTARASLPHLVSAVVHGGLGGENGLGGDGGRHAVAERRHRPGRRPVPTVRRRA
ncbi:hypothetical protein [Streptomyces rubradiris]|uniref:hypothetical protein n=1 Tax=Streptomyces rubradiris TaxID=285531 RepID=UPI003F4CD034